MVSQETTARRRRGNERADGRSHSLRARRPEPVRRGRRSFVVRQRVELQDAAVSEIHAPGHDAVTIIVARPEKAAAPTRRTPSDRSGEGRSLTPRRLIASQRPLRPSAVPRPSARTRTVGQNPPRTGPGRCPPARPQCRRGSRTPRHAARSSAAQAHGPCRYQRGPRRRRRPRCLAPRGGYARPGSANGARPSRRCRSEKGNVGQAGCRADVDDRPPAVPGQRRRQTVEQLQRPEVVHLHLAPGLVEDR
jgi:hypothetical protein